MTQTVTGLFDSYADAKAAVVDLETAGVPHGDISLVSRDKEHSHIHGNDAGTDPEWAKGAEGGAVVGGAGGVLAGLGVLAIPGLGPVVAAGWLVAAAVGVTAGAAVGAAAGGLVGAFTKAGVPERDAHVYAESVRRGGTVVSAKVEDSLAARAREILSGGNVVDVEARRQSYTTEGWKGFDAYPVSSASLASPAEPVGAKPV